MQDFFSQGRALGAQSQPVTLDVRPRPAASGTDLWLPARSMSLTATGIDVATAARVGEPLTLTLRLEAQGLGYAQLPKLELPKIDGADVYPDKPTTQDKDGGEWLYGVRERKFAIVPDRPGPLSLPPISVAWWDTAHDTAQTAQVPALTLNVQPAAASASPSAASAAVAHAPQVATPANTAAPSASAPAVVITAQTTEARMWRSLAFVALALWALTLLVWIVWLLAQRRSAPKPVPDQAVADSAPARRTFAAACAREDMPAAARALLAWARLLRPQLRNLGELAQIVSDPAQASALGDLERARYGGRIQAGLSANLARCFAKGPALAKAGQPRRAQSLLPALYPFDR